jgi:hypothetical protein
VDDDEQDREGCIPADELRFVLKHIPTGALWNERSIRLVGGRLSLGREHATFIANFQQLTHIFGVPHRIKISSKYIKLYFDKNFRLKKLKIKPYNRR